MELKTAFWEGEYWYGLCAQHGGQLPLSAADEYRYDFTTQCTTNQEAPLLLSSKGRYLWSAAPFAVESCGGVLRLSGKSEIVLSEGHETLKGAYLAACAAHFPPSGSCPPKEFFVRPQYNTWIELQYDQTQEGILRYAHDILNNGLPAGILMIDDAWNRDYGCWKFRAEHFPDPRGMVDELHALGFAVMLWICPFVSADSAEFRELEAQGVLVRGADGQTAIRKWWNGYSAVLDMSHPGAEQWMEAQCRALMTEYGIDGFKLDAGDICFYRDDDVTHGNVSAYEQCALWARFGARFAYNEYRACVDCAGLPLVQRLCDKPHAWQEGVAQLIPNTLSQGVIGYAYSCPDMIGGGELFSFRDHADQLDAELFVRYAQCAALTPMMQFSAAPWRLLDAEHARLCVEAAQLHDRFGERIFELAQHAARTGEPIARYMEYEFPNEGLEAVNDQFMLGRDVLVAPVDQPHAVLRRVRLPKGQWTYADGTRYEGGKTVEVPAPLCMLPYFVRNRG